ncbi:Gp49 family protein [Salipaludibacillus sp. HK11]|uniref:Gp49 family protein n=1 Tax=Salipaludibacillus sp. HK11 TaxID=3394320 RepID=UPI0039FBFF84
MSRTVTQDQIENLVDNSSVEARNYGSKTTVVVCTLPSGFVIVESSSCVDPANFDSDIAFDICMERITNKLWELEGYRLQCSRN